MIITEVVMDIYDFALQMEKDGEKYYRELMKASTSTGLKKIFALLADEEIMHYTFIDKLRRKNDFLQLADTPILKNVKNIFIEMKNSKQDWRIETTKETVAYSKAFDIEEKSKIFYQEKAAETKDEQARFVLNQLAKAEEKHMRIMENIVEFISRPEPGNWLENAEWHHLDEY
jgi:rubrerythrin